MTLGKVVFCHDHRHLVRDFHYGLNDRSRAAIVKQEKSIHCQSIEFYVFLWEGSTYGITLFLFIIITLIVLFELDQVLEIQTDRIFWVFYSTTTGWLYQTLLGLTRLITPEHVGMIVTLVISTIVVILIVDTNQTVSLNTHPSGLITSRLKHDDSLWLRAARAPGTLFWHHTWIVRRFIFRRVN